MASPKKSSALATTEPQTLAEFNPRDPQTLLATAKQLAQFVTDNKLASNIQGRSYVQAEGWQFLFAVAGLDVICSKPLRLHAGRPEAEICYEAEARLFDQAGREVGYGYALCADSERTKKGWAEYAIASMAQTRAIGKAGRNRFAFVMKAAGFEPTPAEEMSEVGTEAMVVETPKKSAPVASAPASTVSAPSAGVAANGETMAEQLEALLEQIKKDLTSQHITRMERGKMLAGLNKLTLQTAPTSLAKIRQTCEERLHPDALMRARAELRAFANANATALGQEEYNRLHLVADGLTVVAADLIGEMQDAQEWLQMQQQQAA